jgi:tetrahydromethanopterin S-methyltransferase subunit G
MISTEEQIRQIREDLTKQDSRLTAGIQTKLDKEKFSFLIEEDKRKSAATKEGKATFEAALKKLITAEIEKAGESVWKPDSRVYKTPEFMGIVTALTAAAMGATLASIGLTIVKYDFAVLDLTEKINRNVARMANFVTGRKQWQNQFRTSQHKAELELSRKFHDLDHKLSRHIKEVAKKLNKRIDKLDKRVAENTRARRNSRDQVRSTVAASPGTIPSTRAAAADLNELHTRIDQLVAALG